MYSPIEINTRQETLIKDCANTKCVVIGVGGIGNWVALNLALLGVKFIVLFDPDKLELSNLNRTIFKLDQVGKYKTEALKEIILERRPDVFIQCINDYFDVETHEPYFKDAYIYDCTDNNGTRSLLENKTSDFNSYIKLGYDGFDGTFVLNDFESGGWGEDEDNRYTIVPSFFGTPQILAAMGVIETLVNKNKNINTTSFSITDLLKLIRKGNGYVNDQI
jgi:molybdopterin/thiamine biosynthesis adenylyltransferase